MIDTREKLIDVFMHLDRHIQNRDEYGICYTSDFVEAIEVVMEMLKNGVTVQKWIPVTERLPEPFEVVLVYDHTGKSINWAYMTRHREWVGAIMSHIVTHWMPLPEAPKGD